EKAQDNPDHKLQMAKAKVVVPERRKKAPRYTPVSRRQDRPNAILWLTRHHPELKDSQIIKLVGTTKPTIQAIRDRTHWNSANLAPADPVILGLCTQIALDAEVAKAAKNLPPRPDEPQGATLLPVEETAPMPIDAPQPVIGDDAFFGSPVSQPAPEIEKEPEFDADSVFAKLSSLKKDTTEDQD
ncbi:MAG: cell cycle transcriptional regulator TrcR, partial [Pseudomonadota bacterium]